MSDTPQTDNFLRAGNCSPHNPAAFEWAIGLARSIERQLKDAKAGESDAQQRIREWRDLCEKADRENAQLQKDLDEAQDTAIRWFMAASPYATPGSLEEGLKKLEQSLVEAHPECRCHECTAIWERRYPTKNAATAGNNTAPHSQTGSAGPAAAAPIDSTIKPSAWD
jgi:hypothetical protein